LGYVITLTCKEKQIDQQLNEMWKEVKKICTWIKNISSAKPYPDIHQCSVSSYYDGNNDEETCLSE